MNLGKGSPFLPEDGDPWIPVTPHKPAMRGNPCTIELQTIRASYPQVLGSSCPVAAKTQGNQTEGGSWQQLVGIYSDILQDIQGSSAVQSCRSIHPADKILSTRSYSPFEKNWAEQQSASTLLGRSANTVLMQLSQTLRPNLQAIHSCNLQQKSSDAFPVPHQSCYNQNSPPRKEILGASHTTNWSQIAPHTPDQGQQFKNHQLCAVQNISADGSMNQEKDKQITSTDEEKVWMHSDQLLKDVIASPSPSTSTSLKEKNICEVGSFEGIDLDKTPQLKAPKRKKHRPKVVVEGKPKRTPKPTPSRTQDRTPSGRRKSVSKNEDKDATSQEHNEIKPVDATVQSAVKSCRRVLNFEKETDIQEKDQGMASFLGLNRPAAKEEQQNRYNAETQQSGSICNLLNSTNQKSADFLPLSAVAPPTTARDHTLNIIARTINLKTSMAYQTKYQLGHSQVHQQIHEKAIGKLPLHPNTAWANLDREKQLTLQTRIEPFNSLAETNEKRGYKRGRCNISDLTHSPTGNLMQLQFNSKPINHIGKSGIGNSETHKKWQFEDKFHEAASSIASFTPTVQHNSRKIESRGSSGVHVSSSPYKDGRLSYSNLELKNSPRKQTSGADGITNCQYKDRMVVGHHFQEQRYLSEVKLQRQYMGGQFFQQYTESHSPSLLTGITDNNMQSLHQRVPTQASETKTPEVKRQTTGRELSTLAHYQKNVLRRDHKKETGYLPSPRKARGQNTKQEHEMKIDDIIYQLEGMQIGDRDQAGSREKHSALVPYKGDGTIVPFGGFDPIRRRKPRPKVDLDPETGRVWGLLMGKAGSQSTETMDKDKQTWWENERKVFRGRVDSFIARMHLVQGDRRFSRWKGSVVDSVIGVFLTQNVSDHLSSSAFMSLTAEFPLPRTRNSARAWEEPEVQIIDPDGTITYHERKLRQPLYEHNSRESSESSEQRSDYITTEKGIHLVKKNNRATEEEVFSSQNSSESLVLQANGDVQSSSDSEVEDQVILCSANKRQNLKNTLQTERATSLQQHQWHEMRSPLLDNRHIPECQKQPSPVCISHNSASNTGNDVYDYPINSNILQAQGSFAQGQSGHMHPPSEPSGNESMKIPNLRKRKLEDKTKSFDWDILRKQVILKCGKQIRGKDRMDTMNYEALRNADVNKISEIIKERGMNNLLAARIKDFLNRLVRDHGSIDLEWLRDVSPDKAKEYLLSIRGLGLKSVECVRLLTLHHVAFPVDTNVGRIAVRLGWVPLQPLPESMQLHLLELYPVLESIQKYLWPRLCKLDQKTLYELHYQMITFGKVFCTKSKPNCNACPMRAECRHFASAFASTRLALPGSEERSIASSTIPMAPNGSPTLVLKPMLLPPPETNMIKESQYLSSQWEPTVEEPIIEEPTTPEPSTEVLECDIEDIASQDTDEIPTIDLSLEELKLNVREFMKERNVGITEATVSRALVALNVADASIPAPKLKNINRLRTEHQVYEIPDSHPLLEGIDGREPNDTSPYLLAIWTPGETANSTQPPENKCSFQGTGRLCNDETCFSCNSIREANSQIVRGTLLIPCRTATGGSFPLNGTYFQVNEVFADYDTSVNPIKVPRDWLWPLARRTVYFGTSVSAIFRGLSTRAIQYCFWRGLICVRGIDRKTGAPRPLIARLHCSPSTMAKNNIEKKEKQRYAGH